MWKVTLTTLVLLVGCGVEGAKILAFTPFPMPSHHRQLQPIFRELVSRGHHLTVYTSVPMPDPPPNYTQVVVNYDISRFKTDQGKHEDPLKENEGMFVTWKAIWVKEGTVENAASVLSSAVVQELISSDQTFDAVFLTSACAEWAVALKHRFRMAVTFEFVPFDGVQYIHQLFGSPLDPTYTVDLFLSNGGNMNFWQRLHNLVHCILYVGAWTQYYIPKYQAVMDQYLRYEGWESRPSILELLSDVSIVFLNHHTAVNYAYPTSPHFIPVGGVHLLPVAPIPKELESFMDEAQDGVIYFSLGTVILASSLRHRMTEFVNVFSQLKQRVIWKTEVDIPDLPPNVITGKWFPQQSILAHKNLKLFITQGGALSVMEALNHGVPMVSIPFWSDQFRNMAHMEENGYGLGLKGDNITKESIMDSVLRVLNDKRYKEKAVRRMRMIRDSKETPLERVSYWVEYSLRHRGAQHLRSPSASISSRRFAHLDVYFVFSSLLLFILYMAFIMLLAAYRLGLILFRPHGSFSSVNKLKKY